MPAAYSYDLRKKAMQALDEGESKTGVFGVGFNVSIASIIRKTSKKIPTYDDEDIFVLTGADDLVAIYQTSNSEYDITYY